MENMKDAYDKFIRQADEFVDQYRKDDAELERIRRQRRNEQQNLERLAR